jgi:hypothetical protein
VSEQALRQFDSFLDSDQPSSAGRVAADDGRRMITAAGDIMGDDEWFETGQTSSGL